MIQLQANGKSIELKSLNRSISILKYSENLVVTNNPFPIILNIIYIDYALLSLFIVLDLVVWQISCLFLLFVFVNLMSIDRLAYV